MYNQLFTIQSQLLMTLKKKALENTVGKGENPGTSIFCFSHSLFYSTKERNHLFSNICRLQILSIWSYPKFGRLVELRVESLQNKQLRTFKKLKAFVYDNLNVALYKKFVFHKIKYNVEKTECAGNQHFSLFPQEV